MQAFSAPPATASEDSDGGCGVRPPGSNSELVGARLGPVQTASWGPPPPENGGGRGPRASIWSPESSPGPEEEDDDDEQQQEEEHDALPAKRRKFSMRVAAHRRADGERLRLLPLPQPLPLLSPLLLPFPRRGLPPSLPLRPPPQKVV